MLHSIATAPLAGALSRKPEAVATAGYDGSELFENGSTRSNTSPREIGARADGAAPVAAVPAT